MAQEKKQSADSDVTQVLELADALKTVIINTRKKGL